YLLARATLRADDPAVGSLGLRLTQVLLDRAEQLNDWALISLIRSELAQAAALPAGAPSLLAAGAGLASWHATSMRMGSYLLTAEPPPQWIAHQGHVFHPAGSTSDILLFDYPLTGTYEFTAEAFNGPWAGSAIAHNGLGLVPFKVEGLA